MYYDSAWKFESQPLNSLYISYKNINLQSHDNNENRTS